MKYNMSKEIMTYLLKIFWIQVVGFQSKLLG